MADTGESIGAVSIDIAPLVGVTKTAPEFKTLFIVGWQF